MLIVRVVVCTCAIVLAAAVEASGEEGSMTAYLRDADSFARKHASARVSRRSKRRVPKSRADRRIAGRAKQLEEATGKNVLHAFRRT